MDPICAICSEFDEDTNHMVFLCCFARACCFSSKLGINSHSLTAPVADILTNMAQAVDEEQWTEIANTIWSVWRCRNEAVYGGKKPDIAMFGNFLSIISQESQLLRSPMETGKTDTTGHAEARRLDPVWCWIDGSWNQGWKGGIALVLSKGEELVIYISEMVQTCCPLQTEAKAMLRAIQELQKLGILVCDLFTDCKELQTLASSPQPPLHLDWRAFSECYQVWEMLRRLPEYRCCYINRSQNRLADQLAKKGRLQEWELKGYTYPIFRPE